MKKEVLFGMTLLAGLSAQALSSPYAGSVAGEGTYYLYQVETGQWLQPNMTDINQWTTHGSLNTVGFDIQLIKPEGFEGFQIYCNQTNNGSLNGTDEDRFFFDQSRDITDWIFEPVTVDGVTNAYKIKAKATPEGTDDRNKIAQDVYIGAADGILSDKPTDTTWQLVSRAERLNKMVADAANGPVDASWLIPWFDLGRNDRRADLWTRSVTNNNGGGTGFDGSQGYPVQEYWHQITMRQSITLTDLPAGTYAFSVQAFYRDTEIENAELGERYLAGTENLRVNYFAGAASAKVMSIFANAKDAQTDGYSYYMENVGKWVPNNMGDAARAMFDGAYVNEFIQAPVTDGTLTIGIEKTAADHRDWLIHKRFYLQYVSKDVIAEDLSGLQGQLRDLIAEAEALPQTPSFAATIATAKENLQNAKSSSALLAAISEIQDAVKVIKDSKDIITAFAQTKALTDAMGLDATEAVEKYNNAKSKGDYEDAIRTLRYARRLSVADRQADVFPGHPVAPGKYYLYNLGQRQFLCGGSDWGAHAALGMPGVEITLEDFGVSDRTGLQKYLIETGLYNGEQHHLNYRGYMDGAAVDGFAFKPVEGKENVFYIVQGDYDDVHMAWNPYAGTDRGNNDETTVGTECRNLDPSDLNAQWKLVTLDERKALMEKASLTNPVDVTFFIGSPNFNQREKADECWNLSGFNIWGYGSENCYDFICESYNADKADLNYMVEGLPAGVYMVSAQGYFRAGEISNQVNIEPLQLATLYAGNETEDDVLLPNILTESGKAPAEGDNVTAEDGTTYQVPNSPRQAADYFKSGLYKVYTVIEKTDDNDLPMGVMKEEKNAEGDWIVADNFRIYYYGNATTKEEVKASVAAGIDEIVVEPTARPEDKRIFNLQGIEVSNPTVPGIYISNGKKFIVR